MGHTSTHRPAGMSTLDFFRGEFPTLFSKHTVLAHNSTTDAFYAAMRVDSPQAHGNVGDVWALVVKTERNPGAHFNYTYKEMDETVHPGYYDASRAVLDALTPTDNEHANEWRAQVRAVLDKPVAKVGDTIKLPHPLTFGDGVERDTFRVEQRDKWTRRGTRKETVLRSTDGTLVSIPGWKRYAYTIVPAA